MKHSTARSAWAAPAAIFAMAFTGCAGLMITPNQTTLNYALPVLQPVSGSQQDQQLGGVEISTQASPYSVNKAVHREYYVHKGATLVNNQYPADVREVTAATVAPPQLQFTISIQNHLSRTLSLAGVTASFVVGDSTVLLNSSQYADFLAASVEAGQTYTYVINGPPIAGIPAGTAVTLTLGNVATSEVVEHPKMQPVERMAMISRVNPAAGAGDRVNPTAGMINRVNPAAGGIIRFNPADVRSSFGFHYTLILQAHSEQVPAVVSQTQLTPELVQLLAQRVGQEIWGALPEVDRQ